MSIVYQFRQFCDTLKICLKFMMHQLISLVSRLDPPCFLVEEPGYEARWHSCRRQDQTGERARHLAMKWKGSSGLECGRVCRWSY